MNEITGWSTMALFLLCTWIASVPALPYALVLKLRMCKRAKRANERNQYNVADVISAVRYKVADERFLVWYKLWMAQCGFLALFTLHNSQCAFPNRLQLCVAPDLSSLAPIYIIGSALHVVAVSRHKCFM